MSALTGMGAPIAKAPAVIIPTVSAPSVTVSERAAAKAQSLLAAKGHPDGMLRVFVVGGGCSGYQYGMAIATSADEGDHVIEAAGGVRVVVDRDSAPMISGAEIDYVEDLMKSGFTIYNPNAVSSCACGSSFQTAGGGGTPRACN
jgi:iron-sulfur cluster assembly protein